MLAPVSATRPDASVWNQLKQLKALFCINYGNNPNCKHKRTELQKRRRGTSGVFQTRSLPVVQFRPSCWFVELQSWIHRLDLRHLSSSTFLAGVDADSWPRWAAAVFDLTSADSSVANSYEFTCSTTFIKLFSHISTGPIQTLVPSQYKLNSPICRVLPAAWRTDVQLIATERLTFRVRTWLLNIQEKHTSPVSGCICLWFVKSNCPSPYGKNNTSLPIGVDI